jgi:Protein of unknown function (DUF2817)
MAANNFFSRTYQKARQRFLDRATAAGAALDSRGHPLKGPEGEALATDLAWLGPGDAERVLVTISATHGVEGFCGSGVQAGWLESGLHREQPTGTAHLMIHAINPHGFAWLRRVTEDNVDLNRNFVDHDAPYPENPGYEALAGALCPNEWNEEVIAETQKTLEAYAEAHGRTALQSAISGGQYKHRDGIFFGGHAPTWSRLVLEEVFTSRLAHANKVAVSTSTPGSARTATASESASIRRDRRISSARPIGTTATSRRRPWAPPPPSSCTAATRSAWQRPWQGAS